MKSGPMLCAMENFKMNMSWFVTMNGRSLILSIETLEKKTEETQVSSRFYGFLNQVK